MIEVKVTAATIGSLVVSCIIAILNAVSEDKGIISGLPTWLQFIIILLIPPVLTFFSGYKMPSYTSKVSSSYDKNNV